MTEAVALPLTPQGTVTDRQTRMLRTAMPTMNQNQ